MCRFNEEQPQLPEIYTVYKVAIERQPKRYYSIATGIEYIPGKVEQPKGIYPDSIPCFNTEFLKPQGRGYVPLLKGRTSGFTRYEHAFDHRLWLYYILKPKLSTVQYEDLRSHMVIINLELTGGLLLGTYDGENVVAGQEILSIERV